MTPEAQRIAIAEACGWTEISDWGAGGINGKHPTEPWAEVIPDYLNDLNAMHEAEKIFDDALYCRYISELCTLTINDNNSMYMATATQRAEAFLKTINKWTSN